MTNETGTSKSVTGDRPVSRRFEPRSDDIYIATYPRSGTTLVQMMLYQLYSDGAMSFRHIDDVIPFYEKAVRNGQDLNGLHSPRIFKTHLPYRVIGRRTGRYIYISRCGKDVLISYFHLYNSFIDSHFTFETFFESFLTGNVQYGSWFRHVLEWEEQRGDPDILFLRYEEILRDLDRTVTEVAAFLRLPTSADQLRRARECCRFDFMRQHEEKFQPPPGPMGALASPGNFLRCGKSGNWKERLSSEQQVRFDTLAASELGQIGLQFC